MDEETLCRYVSHPDVHRQALADHTGGYSLAVGRDPQHAGAVLILTIDSPRGNQPDFVTVEGESVRLLVKTDFKQPRPF